MKIVVTVKLVPDTNADKRIDPQTKRLVRSGVETVLNPFDEYALEAGLQLKEKLGGDTTVTVLTMAPESGWEVVRKALAMGADDAVIVSDAALEGSDVWATAHVLAGALKKLGFDLVICGTQSTDAITGELPGALAERLGVPGLTYLRALSVEGTTVRGERETDTGYQRIRAELPALASVTKSINEPRYPSLKGIMGAKKKPIAVETGAEFASPQPAHAKTEVLGVVAAPAREPGRVVTAANAEEGAQAIVTFLQEKKLL